MEDIKADVFLTGEDYNLFEKFLNPTDNYEKREEWLREYNEIFDKYLENNLNMRMNMKKRFCILLILYPMSDNEYNVLSKLDKDGRVGYLSKYLIKKARSCNVSVSILNMYKYIKTKLKIVKYKAKFRGTSDVELNEVKNNLEDFTYMIMNICYEKNSRKGKLDNLLGY